MKRSKLERDLIKNIRQSYSKLAGRIKTLLKHPEVYSPALEVFKRSGFYDPVSNNVKNLSVKSKDIKELRSLKSSINYIEGLKTSSLKYAKIYTENNYYLMNSINMLPDDLKDKFWKVYQRFSETYGNYDRIKYSVFADIFAGVGNIDVDELTKEILDLYDGSFLDNNDWFQDSKFAKHETITIQHIDMDKFNINK